MKNEELRIGVFTAYAGKPDRASPKVFRICTCALFKRPFSCGYRVNAAIQS